MKKYKINKSVSLKTVELEMKTRLIPNKRHQILLSLSLVQGVLEFISMSIFMQLRNKTRFFDKVKYKTKNNVRF